MKSEKCKCEQCDCGKTAVAVVGDTITRYEDGIKYVVIAVKMGGVLVSGHLFVAHNNYSLVTEDDDRI